MLAYRQILWSLTFGMSLSSCFQLPTQSVGQVTVLDGSARTVTAKQVSESKSAATIDPQSKAPQLLAAPSSGNLSGASITVQPGSLAIAADLVVEEAVPLGETSLVSELKLTDDVAVQNVGSGLIIRPTEGVDLAQPLTINMPIPISAGFRLQSSQNIIVFYKQYVGESLVSGLIPGNRISIKGDGTVSFEGYFGAYWVALVSKPIVEEVKVKSEEPIVNTQRVSVIQSTGVVAETAIVAKAAIPEIQWKAPELSYNEANRSVTLVASLLGGATVSACKVDLYQSVSDKTGLLFEAGSQTRYSYAISRADAHSLVGRFRCQDSEGRSSVSPWSPVVAIPALRVVAPIVKWAAVDLNLEAVSRTLQLAAKTYDNRALKSCRAVFQPGTVGASSQVVETGSLLSASYVYSGEIAESFTAQFICVDEEGRDTASPWSIAIKIPAKSALPSAETASTLSWNPTSLVLDSAARRLSLSASLKSGNGLSNCRAQYAQDPAAANPFEITSGSSLASTYTPSLSSQHSLYGRFVCSYMGAQVSSPWSDSVVVPEALNANPYCTAGAPAISIYGGHDINVVMFADYMQKEAGTCRYKMDLFVDGSVSFMIRNESQGVNCGRSTHDNLGHGTNLSLSCQTGTLSAFANSYMQLMRGNYEAILDFTSSQTAPTLTLQRMPCSLGDLYAQVAPTSAGFSNPSSIEKMTHLGACEFEKSGVSLASGNYLKITDGLGISCDLMSYFSEGMHMSGSCAAGASPIQVSVNGAYTLTARRGPSADPNNPSSFSLQVVQGNGCSESFYLMGPTAAGSAAMDNVNKFVYRGIESGSCRYEFLWIASQNSPLFRIANQSATLSCGVSSNYSSSGMSDHRYLTCSPGYTDIQSSIITSGRPYIFELQVSPATGTPSSLTINDATPHCPDQYFLQPHAGAGSFLAGNRMMHEVAECLYEYVWTPTSNQGFYLVNDNTSDPNLCSISPGAPLLTTDGAGVYLACDHGHAQQMLAILPAGISLGSSYKVQLDFRESKFEQPPKIKVMPHSASACTDAFYLSGNSDLGYEPNSLTNKFTRVSGCNFEFIYTPTVSSSPLQLTWERGDASMVACGSSAYSIGTSEETSLDCSGGASNVALSTMINSSYRITVSQRTDGQKILAMRNLSNYCSNEQVTLGGLAGDDLTLAQKTFSPLHYGSCVSELLWTPNDGETFTINVSSSYMSPTGCGMMSSSGSLSSDGTFQNVLCGAHDPNLLNPMVISGLGIGTSYKITLDRSRRDLPAKIKLQPLLMALPDFGATWFSGSSSRDTAGMSSGLYPTPGARSHAARWTDASGNLWLFGGQGYATNSTYGSLNDLWKWNAMSGWSLEFGDGTLVNAAGVYGTMGSPSVSNIPGARFGATTWFANNKLWLFGGHGYDIDGVPGKLSDLWSYDLSTAQWTWVKGSSGRDGVGNYSNGYGEFSNSEPYSRSGAVAWTSAAGQLWLYGGDSPSGFLSDLWRFTPGTGRWDWVGGGTAFGIAADDNQPGGLAHATTWTTTSGEFWLFGGTTGSNTYQYGLWRLDPSSASWDRISFHMGPSSHGTRGVMSPGGTSHPSARDSAGGWVDGSGNLWLIGGHGIDYMGNSYSDTYLNDVWVYSPAHDQWAWVKGSMYAHESGMYTNVGSYSSSHRIGARKAMSVWYAGGKTYVFGGYGRDASSSLGFMNDLWQFDTSSP